MTSDPDDRALALPGPPAPLRPARLRPGDTVATVSPSSGHAERHPHVYRAGVRALKELLGLRVVEAPNALRSDGWLARHPEARADDLHWALARPAIKGIVATIGGDDAVRILPHLDVGLVRAHPKVFLGFSDATAVHAAWIRAGVASFYGPSVMAGIAELPVDPYALRELRLELFEATPRGALEPPATWTERGHDWGDPDWRAVPPTDREDGGWRFLQGDAPAEGPLVGGCFEVLEMLKGTPFFPPPERWHGAVWALETSELAPDPAFVEMWLRNYAVQGLLERAAGLVLARPRGYDEAAKARLAAGVKEVLWEAGRPDLPVLLDAPTGHTRPMAVLPLGARARLEPAAGRFVLLESGVS